MDRWEGKIAVVTGASAGIGAAIAEELVKAGVLVVGLARRLERLEKLAEDWKEAKGTFYPRRCDLRNETDISNAFEWINAELGGVDILVNNAAISKHKRILDDTMDSFREILDVNILAAVTCCQKAVASMKDRDVAGHIIIINSVLGQTFPDASFKRSLYPSSKHALKALTETLRKELANEKNNKIKMTSLSPGFVKTEMALSSGSTPEIFYTAPYIEPKNIADAVLYLLGTPQNVQVSELMIRHINETL